MFIDESSTSLFLSRVKRIYLRDLWDEGVLEFDGMVERVMWREDIIGLFREDVSKG